MKREDSGGCHRRCSWPMESTNIPDATPPGDNLCREFWNRNRLQEERAAAMIAQKRWWEALMHSIGLDASLVVEPDTGSSAQVEQEISGSRPRNRSATANGEWL